jgi:hypothetical protein
MFALAACGRPANTADATTAARADPAPVTTTPAPAEPAPEPWRYAPALAAAVPAGHSAAPVLELADGVRGRARIVVAVATGDAPVRLEIWDFSQNNERGVLARLGDPVVLLDLRDIRDADARLAADAVADLRREIASPGNEVVRPLGLPGEPTALPAELARLAAACTGTGDAPTRTHALARLIRGLDDHLVWEQARLPELLRRLQTGPWTVGEATPLGARRMRLAATEDARPLQLELARTQDRWALVAVEG